MKEDNSMETLLKVLCEINNRLTEIAITLQTLGWLSRASTDESVQTWLKTLSELSLSQQKKYMTLTKEC